MRLPALFIFCLAACTLFTQPELEFQSYITDLSSPVDIANAGDGSGRLFIVEKGGTIKIIQAGALVGDLLDISSKVSTGGEQGLLGLAFHPDFSTNNYFYVNYTNTQGTTVVSRFTIMAGSPNSADPNSELIILTISQPYGNHNAGDVEFGPDGYLYITSGDGGSGNDPQNNSQNGLSLLGKILRIDVDGSAPYTIPADNPFVGDPNIRDEIWALGLRNPWRFSFDRQTGDLWIGDVGQNRREEIDFQPASSSGGENYGWRCYEANLPNNTSNCGPMSSYVFPVFDYGRSNATGGQSVTGGYVYRGNNHPGLQGLYIFCDFASNNCWTLEPDGSGGWTAVRFGNTTAQSISTFGEDENGELYAANYDGTIYEVIDDNPLPLELSHFNVIAEGRTHLLRWQTRQERNTSHFEVQRSLDGSYFEYIGRQAAAGNSNELLHYAFTDNQPFKGTNYYRLKQLDLDGQYSYSNIISIHSRLDKKLVVVPNPGNGNFQVWFDLPDGKSAKLKVFDIEQRIVHQQAVSFHAGRSMVDLSNLANGLYFVQLSVAGQAHRTKLLLRRR